MNKISPKLCISAVVLFSFFALGAKPPSGADYQALLGKISKSIDEQKFQAALDIIKAEGGKIKDPVDQARVITKIVQIETGLHDYETAVKNFRATPWPKDPKAQALLNIFNAYSLHYYAQMYAWEISQRTKIESKGDKDLKSWTIEEIFFESVQGLNNAWAEREKLGNLPKDLFSDYMTVNNYPAGIRDTFRDVLSHLFVDILNDSSGWTPQQSNEIYQLNLSNLLNGKLREGLSLKNTKVHPIEKIAFILRDLQAWNIKNKNMGAALDAHLELVKILHSRFSEAEDKAEIRKHLELLLPKYASTPWYSMGMADLAQFWQAHDSTDALTTAVKIAQEGVQKYPTSLGAKACRDVIKQIQQAAIEMQTMRVDGQARRSIGVDYRNLTKLHFFSYKYDLKKYMLDNRDYNHYPDYREIQKIRSSSPYKKWTVDVPATTDYRSHKAFITPPKHDPGFYIVAVSKEPTLQENENIIRANMMTFGDLVISNQITGGKIEFEVRDGNSGAPVKGAALEIYKFDYQKSAENAANLKTDENGSASFDIQGRAVGSNQFVAFASLKNHFTFQEFYLYDPGETAGTPPIRAMIYTDRSIYRPLQKVKWKTIFYQYTKEPGKFKIAPNTSQTVTLVDMNGQVVSSKQVQTDDFGAAWGEFDIPTGKALGQWSLRAAQNNQSVRVEEYKRPTFEMTWKPQVSPLRLNKKAEIIGEAKYYFGAPLPSGKVRYTVHRSIIFPWWCFYGYWNFGAYQRAQLIDSGVASIQPDGTFTVPFFPKADERFAKGANELKYSYAIAVDVTDEGGETRSTSKSVTLGMKAVEASLTSAEQFALEGKSSTFKLLRTSVGGDPAPGTGSWELFQLTEPSTTVMPAEMPAPSYLKKLRPPGLFFPDDSKQARFAPNYNWTAVVRDWASEKSIKKSNLQTDKDGQATLTIPALSAGAYRIVYKTTDAFGVPVETQTEFFVANDKYKPALPGLLLINKPEAKVGEEVSIWIPTGLKNQKIVFEVFQDGKLKEIKRLTSSESALLKYKVTEDMRGGLGFNLRLINDYQNLNFSSNLFVPWDNKEISVDFASFREKLRPGQKETWTLKLTGPKKEKLQKASAQVLAYMYDRSLDQLAPHNSQGILSLYPNRFSSRAMTVELGSAQSIYFPSNYYYGNEFSPPHPDSPNFYYNYGIGGPGRRGFARGGMEMEGGVMAMDAVSESKAVPQKMMARNELAKSKDDAPAAAPPSAESTSAKPAEAVQIRSNFSETAFFQPNLVNNENGSIDIKFEVPDSVTSWSLWLQGFTKDFMALTSNKQVQTVKDLLIRPYLPRFLREGDNAELRFVLNNTSNSEINGTINIDLLEEDQKADASKRFGAKLAQLKNVPFKIKANGSFTHKISLQTPAGLGSLVVKAVAQGKNQSDGELRVLPILPGRFHLAQSKFVTLKDKDQRVLEFKDLSSGKDKSLINEKLVVQIDAQLFYSVLTALPYLVNYPYECVEQTLNRFISTGIMSSLFNKYPSVEKMAREMSQRKTQTERFDEPDPNRRMSLEETPWLVQSKGGSANADDLINVLDSRVAKKSREDSLTKLEKAQTSLGGFPWFPGGPPSPYMTLYVVYGFSKAMEFGVDVPKPMIQKAFSYLHKHYIDEIVRSCMSHDSCWELITFLNYTLSNFPDESWGGNVFTASERQTMLNFSFKHWKLHSPYLKGYLALTLYRFKRPEDSKLVWDSVMDSAKYSQDEGTHWAREDRSWLWYNDTIETHAFALRTLMELGSDNTKRDGLVQWLFLNKKLNHWQSTRATSEVIYSLAHYLTKTEQMGSREAVTVKIGKEKPVEMEFTPDKYTGKKNQIVYEGDKVNAGLMPISVQKSTPGFMFASANWQFSTEELPKEDVGDFLNVSRKFFLREKGKKGAVLKPLSEGAKIQVGDEVEVHLSLRSKHPVGYVHLRDPRGAGFEPVDNVSQHKWQLGIYWYEEIRDSGTNFFFEQLPQGEYNFKYRIRASTAGEFKVSPATVQPMYAPEFAAYSSGLKLKIAN